MTRTRNRPELLLPAGEMASVIAAVQNGADAVYLGGVRFSARQNAKNFDEAALEEAVSYCHARGVKVYQTLNTLIFDGQMPLVRESIRLACRLGIDALIVQDWGVLALARETAPELLLHASTQMTVHTPAGAQMLKEMGASRVVLARELSEQEIREIVQQVEIETEVFVHGALCMSVSGQCYLSGMIGGRSGNRGNCAGTCRLPFSADGKPGHALSLKDLCLAGQVERLAEIGVTSLKVEGRMKRPEYVAAAAAAYSNAAEGEAPDLDTLQAVFSRSGFTNGYFTAQRGREMFGFRQKEDVLAATGSLLKSLENSYRKEKGRIPLSWELELQAGRPARLAGQDGDGFRAEAAGPIPEPARNRPASRESLARSLGKLGGSIFWMQGCRIQLDEGLMLPVSALNDLRRQVCAGIQAQREQKRPHPFREEIPLDALAASRQPSDQAPRLRARFARFSQLSPETLNGLDYYSLPLDEVCGHSAELFPDRNRLLVEPDRVCFGREPEIRARLAELRAEGFSQLLCGNIAHVKLARELGWDAFGGVFLNCSNSLSAAELARLGVRDLTLSFELNRADLLRLAAPVPRGFLGYGRLPLMVFRNCPVRSHFSCRDCSSSRALTDRMGKIFPVICGRKQYAELLNCHPLELSDRLDEFQGMDSCTLYFTVESREQVQAVLERYRSALPPEGEFTRGLYFRNV